MRFVAVFAIAATMLLACVASEQKVERAEPVRVDTTETLPTDDADLNGPLGSVQPNVHPASPEEWDWQAMNVRTETAQPPLRKAPVHVVRFDRPALPTPILDGRRRECIGFPIIASPRVKRMNLALGANVYEYEGMHILWRDPKWREFHRIAPDGSFGVNIWRVREGVATYVDTLRVPGGPDPSFVQFQLEQLYPNVWRGGDMLCLEALKHGGTLMIYYDQSAEFMRGPWINVIEQGSNDPGVSFGAWTTIGGADVQQSGFWRRHEGRLTGIGGAE